MQIQSNSLTNTAIEKVEAKDRKVSLDTLKSDKVENKIESHDKLTNQTKKSNSPAKTIDFEKLSSLDTNDNGQCELENRISDSAIETANNKVSYKDRKDLDHGNLACATAVSNILNKLPEFKNVHQIECAQLSQDLLKKGFNTVFSATKAPEKKQPSDFKVGDVVFFPRETEQYGLKNMGHVGIVAKDKQTGELMMVNNGWALDKSDDGKYSTESRVMAVPLERYLAEKNITMILRHK